MDKDAMSIYEVHPGSWKKHPAQGEDDPGFYNYRELAHELAKYVKEMGYTMWSLWELQNILLTVHGDIR